MIKNLIFDVDGTIWDNTEIVAGAWTEVAKLTGFRDGIITAEELKGEFGKPMDEIIHNLFPGVQSESDLARTNDLVNEIEDRFLRECSMDLTYTGIVDTIRELAGEFEIFIVSNCQDGYIELMLEKTGLLGYVRDFTCFGVTGLPKSGSIMKLMDRNQLEGEETVYIGDTQGDYDATKEAGLKFIFASYGFGHVETPDAVFYKSSELKNAVLSCGK